eukprot:m.7145 g.7145  ORF g.7145 m.7145 type:complete len:161 (-) comp3651_c0_seq3:58-540(-)
MKPEEFQFDLHDIHCKQQTCLPSTMFTPAETYAELVALRNASLYDMGSKVIMGHGDATGDKNFTYAYALLLLVTSENSTGYFLNNHGYNVDEGLLDDFELYHKELGVPCAPFSRIGSSYVLHRAYSLAQVTVDISNANATIEFSKDRNVNNCEEIQFNFK